MKVTANSKSAAAAESNVKAIATAIRNGSALPVGRMFISRPIELPAEYSSGLLLTKRGGGIAGTCPTSIQQLGTGPVFRVQGTGLSTQGTVELIGDGKSAAVEIAGDDDPTTGRHAIDRLVIQNAASGIKFLNTPSENHADNSDVNCLEVFNVATAVVSENQQALNWHIKRLVVNHYAGGPAKQTVVDAKRGGLLSIGRLVCCHPVVQVLRVSDYSPNQGGFTIDHLQFDLPKGDAWLSLFEYAGPTFDHNPDFDMRYMRWRVRVHDGFIPPSKNLDLSQWINLPEALKRKGSKSIDLSDIRWDVRGIDPPVSLDTKIVRAG